MQYPLGNSGAGALVFLGTLFTLFTSIFWLVVGWRAMRAHEDIAAALRERRNPPV